MHCYIYKERIYNIGNRAFVDLILKSFMITQLLGVVEYAD